MKGSMMIDGHRVDFDGAKNLLEIIRKTGIDLPTFCYHSELSVYGGCRMCIVEDKSGRILTSCSTPPKDGMEIYTNTPRLRKYRRITLELILSNHDRDCTICEKNGKCKLQELATRFGVKRTRFNSRVRRLPVDQSSPSIVRNPNKCIMCGDCVRMCKEIQGIGILQLDLKGEKLKVDINSSCQPGKSGCVDCGQCTTVCPTGALVVKNDTEKVWNVLQNENKRVVAQVAPAVRVGIGEEFGRLTSENMLGKIAAALRKLGFDAVYDMAFAADLTAMEESKELMERVESKEGLPMFTSCCPAWVKFAEKKYPEILGNLSNCRSPQQILGGLLKEHYKSEQNDSKDTIVVSIVPCTAKKMEAQRPENSKAGVRDVDIVITTQELAIMIREAGIVFNELEQEAMDNPFGLISGAGVIFGVTGGVTEAVLRKCCSGNNP
ncbi:MAG: hydrogenase, Fe-only, partial [Clostridiales bacterium]|nr:hydrogenase, Fe-only [Clostridiales bacterium]